MTAREISDKTLPSICRSLSLRHRGCAMFSTRRWRGLQHVHEGIPSISLVCPMKICASRVFTPKNKTSSRVKLHAEINDVAKIKDKSGMASERVAFA
jgi:hypothetical protein